MLERKYFWGKSIVVQIYIYKEEKIWLIVKFGLVGWKRCDK